MLLGPDQCPGSVFPRKLAQRFVIAVVGLEASRDVVGVTDVELACRVLKNVGPEHSQQAIGSRGRARTYNPPVNSRLLYH